MDSVKQSAALCLLRLYRTSPDLVPMGDWTARVVHLLNDQHLVCLYSCPSSVLDAVFKFVRYSHSANWANYPYHNKILIFEYEMEMFKTVDETPCSAKVLLHETLMPRASAV